VNEDAPAHIHGTQDTCANHFIRGVEQKLKDDHDEHLKGRGFPLDGAEGDEDCTGGKVGGNEVDDAQADTLLGVALIDIVAHAIHDHAPLDSESCDKEIHPHAAEGVVLLQEGHEKAKANKYHHVYILVERIVMIHLCLHVVAYITAI
jgi:hypothetical protein